MPPRFDGERLQLRLSVADLLDTSLTRSLGFSQRGGFERLWLGQAIHGRYQEAAREMHPGYRAEVPIVHHFQHRGWTIEISGRIDGLRREDGSLIVEEIKSVRELGRVAPALHDIYACQARLYAWILRQQGESNIRAELIWIEIGSDDLEHEPLELDERELEATIFRRLNALIKGFAAEETARAERRHAADTLQFPYSETRPGQEQIMEAVDQALESNEQLLIEAPTGLGKTVATLLPALRHALRHDKRVMVLTAKNLQQEMVTQVLAMLNETQSFHSLRLRAKARMCAHDEILCHEEYCPYARDYFLKLDRSGLLGRLLDEYGTLLPDAVFAAARAEEVCPFEVSLELAGRAQVVVGDYNYVFDPYVALRDFHEDGELEDWILIVDEAHNLVDRGRGYYSPALSSRSARTAAETIRKQGGELGPRLSALALELASLIERHVDRELEEMPPGECALETGLPTDDLWMLRPEFDRAFVDHLEHRRATRSFRAEDPFVELYFDLLRFLKVLEVADDAAFSHYVDRQGDEARLCILCKDPSRFLGRVLGAAHAVIGLSATLSPRDFYRDLLGLDRDRSAFLTLPSPFPRENRRIVIDVGVATAYRQRSENYAPIAARIAAFAQAVPGNCLALFPSYAFLQEVAERLPPTGRRVLVQTRQGDEKVRDEILQTLRRSLLGDVLLLAVAGGVFAEGVDYPGEMLKGVAIVGPCLPGVDLERQLLRTYYQERFERGFEYAFVVPGMTRVIQAAGRLIRSAGDQGVIGLLGRRFLAAPYRHHLPGDWLDGAEPDDLAGDLANSARAFFEGLEPRVVGQFGRG